MLVDLIEGLPPEQRPGALAALDACTRPMTPRELEHALREVGVSHSRAKLFVAGLKRVAIVAVCMEGGR